MFLLQDGPSIFLKDYFKMFNVEIELSDLLVDDS